MQYRIVPNREGKFEIWKLSYPRLAGNIAFWTSSMTVTFSFSYGAIAGKIDSLDALLCIFTLIFVLCLFKSFTRAKYTGDAGELEQFLTCYEFQTYASTEERAVEYVVKRKEQDQFRRRSYYL